MTILKMHNCNYSLFQEINISFCKKTYQLCATIWSTYKEVGYRFGFGQVRMPGRIVCSGECIWWCCVSVMGVELPRIAF